MLQLKRSNSDDKDFIALVHLLDQDLAHRDGNETAFYSRYNKVDLIKHVIVAYKADVPVAIGAIKEYETGVMEVKRMFTIPESRGKGYASRVLTELERWAAELGNRKLILETGKRNPEAMAFYKAKGYTVTASYPPYVGVDNSVCFEKPI